MFVDLVLIHPMASHGIKRAKDKYRSAKKHSRERGILFLLTFEQWIKIWLDSGHWEERGRGFDKFCMARYGDKGPYAIGNVKIITNQENGEEQIFTDETRKKMSNAGLGRKFTLEHRKNLGLAQIGNTKWRGNIGRKNSEEVKEKMSQARFRFLGRCHG